jgi:hypothetical protein
MAAARSVARSSSAVAKSSGAAAEGAGAPAESAAAGPRGQARKPSLRPPRSDQRRLAELKVKLADADYMNGAILRIATVLSARLTLR